MERNCEKCVYHTSGSCSKWECEGTKTRKDIENEAYQQGRADAIKEFYLRLDDELKKMLNSEFAF